MTRETKKSAAAFARASKVLVGGVNSPVRSFAAVGGQPPIIDRGAGAKLFDIDGNEYIDFVGSYGPAILGCAPEAVVTAVSQAVRKGASFGAPTQAETLLAERIVAAIDSVEKVRFTNSGTEAVMTAIRLARGVTGREKILKFVGCYHGHADAMLVSAGSGSATLGVPSSPGAARGATADTLLAPFNCAEAVAEIFQLSGEDIAAVIVEPVAGNMGVVPPAEDFLQTLRQLCDRAGSLLIFDEVMTGFRLAYGGAQQRYGIRPDITTLGKIIGGGLAVGAVAASAEIMDHLAPVGPVYQAGTLSGNPLAMAAGLATLDNIAADVEFYDKLEQTSAQLEAGLLAAAAGAGLAGCVCINRVGAMLSCFFHPGPVTNYAQASQASSQAFGAYFHHMLKHGVYLPPSQMEAMFVSASHNQTDIQATCEVAGRAFLAAREVM
jgi:glutamate-1-semialdehyde 2,1-aminomutase